MSRPRARRLRFVSARLADVDVRFIRRPTVWFAAFGSRRRRIVAHGRAARDPVARTQEEETVRRRSKQAARRCAAASPLRSARRLRPERALRRQRRPRVGAATDLGDRRSTTSFSVMASLKSIAADGQGQDRGHPARHRLLGPLHRVRRAVPEGGLHEGRACRRREFTIQNAQGSDSTQLTDAQADITKGATVLARRPARLGRRRPDRERTPRRTASR